MKSGCEVDSHVFHRGGELNFEQLRMFRSTALSCRKRRKIKVYSGFSKDVNTGACRKKSRLAPVLLHGGWAIEIQASKPNREPHHENSKPLSPPGSCTSANAVHHRPGHRRSPAPAHQDGGDIEIHDLFKDQCQVSLFRCEVPQTHTPWPESHRLVAF